MLECLSSTEFLLLSREELFLKFYLGLFKNKSLQYGSARPFFKTYYTLVRNPALFLRNTTSFGQILLSRCRVRPVRYSSRDPLSYSSLQYNRFPKPYSTTARMNYADIASEFCSFMPSKDAKRNFKLFVGRLFTY